MRSGDGQVWQTGVVVDASGSFACVRFEPLADCQRCLSGTGCGAGVFGRLFARRAAEWRLPNPRGLYAGQRVRVGVSENELLMLALLLYGVPLVTFILVAGLAATLLPAGLAQDLLALVSGLLAAGASLVVAGRLRSRALNPTVQILSAKAGCARLESGRE